MLLTTLLCCPFRFKTVLWSVVTSMLFSNEHISAQAFVANYDEASVSMSPLPDPLIGPDRIRIQDKSQWPMQRDYLVDLIAKNEFGIFPSGKAQVTWDEVEQGWMYEGKTKRTQFVVHLKSPDAALDIEFALFQPTSKEIKGCFLGLNFQGNHSLDSDPLLRISKSWFSNDSKTGVTNNQANESNRGGQSRRWPIREINEQGYAVATAYYGDIDPDFDDGFKNGVHALFPSETASKERPDRWGSIAGWAWGMSRLLDVLAQQPGLPADRFAAIGHSRLGKTALWAGATDPRFSIVISNNSGCGGAAIERRNFGETVARINTSFPHWFCPNFKQYNRNEHAMPFDQHTLIACIAPRPVYIASATQDQWADPKGEYLGGFFANPVYEMFGRGGLPSENPPEADKSVGDGIGYHSRTGAHDILWFDWQQYIRFADRHWNK